VFVILKDYLRSLRFARVCLSVLLSVRWQPRVKGTKQIFMKLLSQLSQLSCLWSVDEFTRIAKPP